MTSIEELSKTQIILLTLLVTFVTSIATGIITTALLAEAPQSVTQTINRVVERTIETVTPAPTNNGKVKEVTVVSEEDAILSSINKSLPSVVRIKEPIAPDDTQSFYALGIIVSKEGLVVSDLHSFSPGTYSATLSDGTNLILSVVSKDEENGLILFKLEPNATHLTFTPVSLASKDLVLGQSVIAIEGKEKNSVAVGRVNSVDAKSLETNLPTSGEVLGGPIFNLSGELSGIKTNTVSSGSYVSLSVIRNLVKAQ